MNRLTEREMVAKRIESTFVRLIQLFVLLTLLMEPLNVFANPMQGGGTGLGGGGGLKGRRENTPAKAKPASPPSSVTPSPSTAAPPAPTTEPSQARGQDDARGPVSATDWLRDLIRRDLPIPTGREVIVVQLRGPLEGAPEADNLLKLPDYITSISTKVMLEVASHRDPLAIVISIDSPGGRIDVMNGIIDEIATLQLAEKHRVVAWPRLAGSAAAMITCACREIVVRSDCKIGAATPIDQNGEKAPPPTTALDHKLAAVDEARFRQLHELTKRDQLIVDAFRKPELTLYYHLGPPVRFATTIPNLTTKPPAVAPGWSALDSSTSMPLVLTAEEARNIGLALPNAADDITEVIKVLGLPPKTPVVEIRMDTTAIRSAAAERWARYEESWAYINSLTAPLIERIKKSIHKLRTALQTPKPKNREEARSIIRLLAQARATLTVMSDSDATSIKAAITEVDGILLSSGRHVAQLEKIDFVVKDLRGAEDLLNHSIKHGSLATQAVDTRILFAIQLLEEAWTSLTKSGRAE